MTPGGHSGNWGGDQLAEQLRWLWSDQITSTPLAKAPEKSAPWQTHPDAIERSEVPHGVVEEMAPWESKIFPNTTRKWSIYVLPNIKKRPLLHS